MRGPTFFIVGAAKAATTALSSLLTLHPEAAIVRGKEPHFFSRDETYGRGMKWYGSLFDGAQQRVAIGDASTSYSRIRYHPNVISRIKRHVPRAKIIYMVRHPLDRMEAAYVEHLCSPGSEIFASISDAVLRCPMIVDSSRYWEVFEAYRAAFGESQIKIVWFEEYVASTVAVFDDVCRFLGIRETGASLVGLEQRNSRETARVRMAQLGRSSVQINTAWDPDVRRWVVDSIWKDSAAFLSHFKKPTDHWGGMFS